MDRETSHSTLQQRFGRRSGARRHDRKSTGFGRVLIVVYWVFSLSAGVRSLYQLATEFSLAPLAILLSTFSAAVYVVATIALSRSGARWHRVATAAVREAVARQFPGQAVNVTVEDVIAVDSPAVDVSATD